MITDKKIGDLATLLGSGKLKSTEITEAFLKKIEDLNGKLNSFITVDNENAMNLASESDKRRKSGKHLSDFDGIPIAIKDNICTDGIRTTCASKILENFIPPYDATCISKLKQSGFITLGKTNMDEFAMGSTNENSFFGPARNPFDTDRVTGGSSGGSASAVSSSMAPGALGSDTGGSIRQPASFCGVVGIKPTYGRVSRYGLVAFASSLDQIGTFGKCVDDAALLLSVISGYDSNDSTSVDKEMDFYPEEFGKDISNMVIGVPDEYFRGVTPEVKDLIEKKIDELSGLGAKVEKISLKYIDYAVPVYYLIATAEASSNLARFDGVRYGYRSPDADNLEKLYYKTRSEGFGDEVKRRIILGTYSLSSGYYDAYYLKALKVRSLIIKDFRDAFSHVDVIVTPTVTTTAFKLNELLHDPLQLYMLDILTISANLAGIPGVSVPVGTDSRGLPIGLQIMGNHFQEKKMLNLAGAVESLSEPVNPKV